MGKASQRKHYLLPRIINSAHSLCRPYWTDMAGLNAHSKSARCHLLPAPLDCTDSKLKIRFTARTR